MKIESEVVLKKALVVYFISMMAVLGVGYSANADPAVASDVKVIQSENNDTVDKLVQPIDDGIKNVKVKAEVPDFDLNKQSDGVKKVKVVDREYEKWLKEKATASKEGVPVPNGAQSEDEGMPPCNSVPKTYMPYTAVKSKATMQYKVLYGEGSHTDHKTGFRMNGDRYCIALAQAWGLSGTKVDLVMANGAVIKCVIGDSKAIIDTDPTRRWQAVDGSVVEIIVDYNWFKRGNVNWLPDEFKGKVDKIHIVSTSDEYTSEPWKD